MAKKTAPLLPATDELLRKFGDRLRLARLRRRLAAKQVAERAGMAPMTLRSLERGGAGVTIGAYLAVMQVLGIEGDLEALGKSDPLGRELQDARLPTRAEARGRPPVHQAITAPPSVPATRNAAVSDVSARPRRTPRTRAGTDGEAWIEKSGFTSADALAGLIESPAVARDGKAR